MRRTRLMSTEEVTPVVRDQPSVAPVTPERTPTPAADVWTDVGSWDGWTVKETETLTITSSEWRIVWNTEPEGCGEMEFQLSVYTVAGELRSVAAGVISEGRGVSYVPGAGDHYLVFQTEQYYSVIVQQTQ
jgi:hypothetical protein